MQLKDRRILIKLMNKIFFVDVVRNEENQVSGRCQSEMNAHRKMLMDDYNISPEVVSKCAKDIQVKIFEMSLKCVHK